MSMTFKYRSAVQVMVVILIALRACVCSLADKPAAQGTSSTKPASPISLSIYLPSARLNRADFGAPILVEWQASEEFAGAKKVCLIVRPKEVYDQFAASLDRPPVDPLDPHEGDGLWLTYRSIEKLSGRSYMQEYVTPFKFIEIDPGKTGYAKLGLITQAIAPGRIELQAHLVVDRKVTADSSPVEVPLDEAGSK